MSEVILTRVGVEHRILVNLALILGFSWVTALCARISFPLPWTQVPVSGQTFAVLLAGAILGSRRGALSQMAYLAQGAAGLPVFAWTVGLGYGGGVARFIGPTGGYLMGFVAMAFVVGLLAERGWDRRFSTTAAAMVLGNITLYAFGLPWLAHFVPSGSVLTAGLYPFIPGDLIKLVIAALALPSTWMLLRRWQG